jgi:hypothetical protein
MYYSASSNLQQVFSAGLKIYMPAILSVKLCILIGFHRIFQVDTRTRWLIRIGMAVNVLFYFICFFVDLFRCTPMATAWNPSIKGKCLSYTAFPWVTGVFNIISDFYILLIPMPLLFGLHMDMGRRVKLIAIFGLGLLQVSA